MIRQEQIAAVIDAQKKDIKSKDDMVFREILNDVPVVESFATIISGIRRCGKSTLVTQLIKKDFPNAIFLNFEDIRLVGFDAEDFKRLHKEILSREQKTVCFDEIQLVKNWEMYIHQILREGYRVFITGSNASLLSHELGSQLTGRYLKTELFSFSYNEFLQFTHQEANRENMLEYLKIGGMPEYVRNRKGEILIRLAEDILLRDIAARKSIRDARILKQLLVYLLSNTGNLISAGKLKGMFGVQSATTFLEYFSYLQDSYLLEFIPQFSYSLKVQGRNPRKVYTMDNGFISQIGAMFSENKGHLLENMIYLHLRRKFQDIFYFKGKGECDFVVLKNSKLQTLVQVCYEIDDLNFDREVNGLLEAMKFFEANSGIIVSMFQNEVLNIDEKEIEIVEAKRFLLEQDNS